MTGQNGQQRISSPAGHDWFTMLPNLLDVWRDENGELLEHWAVRVYFHYARLCSTSRTANAEESERETARNTGMSSGLAHKARKRLADTGWIDIEFEGPFGHEVAYITLVDRWTENHEHWERLRPKKQNGTSGLRSHNERRAVGAHENGVGAHPVSSGAHELSESVSAKTVPSSLSLKIEDVEDKKPRACAREIFSDDFRRRCEECGDELSPIHPAGLRVCIPCAKGSRARASPTARSPA